MNEDHDLGPQPLGELLTRHALKPHDLVAASSEQLTHKMVARAVKGRRLTPRVMWKVLGAFNAASGESYELDNLFTYVKRPNSRLSERRPGVEELLAEAAPSAGETSTDQEASYTCPSCGETIVVPVDSVGARREEYVEDCPVCCTPVVLRVEVDESGAARITAEAE